MKWRLMTDFPEKTGRYCVGHRGQIFSDAYYVKGENETHYPVGWHQLPQFGPTHWLDDDYEMEGELENRFDLKGKDEKKDYSDGWRAGQRYVRREIIRHLKKLHLKRAYRELFR